MEAEQPDDTLRRVYEKYYRSVGCHQDSKVAPREKKKRALEDSNSDEIGIAKKTVEEETREIDNECTGDASSDNDENDGTNMSMSDRSDVTGDASSATDDENDGTNMSMSDRSEITENSSVSSDGWLSDDSDDSTRDIEDLDGLEPLEVPDAPEPEGAAVESNDQEDLVYFWLLVTLDYSLHDEAVRRQEMIASSIAVQGTIRCGARDVFRLRESLLEKYSVRCIFKCSCSGHNRDLLSESVECPDCERDHLYHNLKRGSISERMRILTCNVRIQLLSVMDKVFPFIREHHTKLHGMQYSNTSDASDNRGPAFLSSLETEQEFAAHSIVIQMVINGDGFQLPGNTRGGMWAFYLALWDVPSRLRRCPEMSIFAGLIGYGSGNRVDFEIIDMLLTDIQAQVHALANRPIVYLDENGVHWNCTFRVTAQVHDAEGQCKINGVPNWSRREHGCQLCYTNEPIQHRYIGPTRYEGVPGRTRTVASTRNDAIRLANGYTRYSVMHRILSPCMSYVDVLHSVDLGIFKDLEIAMRAGDTQASSHYPHLRLPRQTRLELNYQSTVAMLPTYYPVTFMPFISGSKNARETRLSVLLSVSTALMEIPFIRWGRLSGEDADQKIVSAIYMSLVILNLRRLMDPIVDQRTLNDISERQRQLGRLQEECVGKQSYKFHLVNAHLPQQLRSVGNLCDSDTASFEHLHQYLKRSLITFNKGTFEAKALQRALLRFEVAESCKRRAVTTTHIPFALYMKARERGRVAAGSTTVGCVTVPPRSEVLVVDPRLARMPNCTRFFRTVVYARMLLSSHDPLLGKEPPAKSRQNLISACANGALHFGEMIVVGASITERLHVMLKCFNVDNPLNILAGFLDNVQHPHLARLTNHFGPYASRYIVKVAPGSYDLIVPIECIFGQYVKISLNNSMYLISLPARIY